MSEAAIKLAVRIRSDENLLKLIAQELMRTNQEMFEHKAPLTPNRRAAMRDALNILKGGPE